MALAGISIGKGADTYWFAPLLTLRLTHVPHMHC